MCCSNAGPNPLKKLFAAVLPFLVAGCASVGELEDVSALTAAADPAVAGPAPSGPNVAYTPHSIEDPADWRSLNDAQREGGR